MTDRRIDVTEAKQQFTQALRSRHLVPSKSLVDGKGRCDVTNKTHGREDGRYVLHLDGWPAGAFINYTDDIGWTTWKYQSSVSISSSERQRLFAETRKQQAEAHDERAKTMRSVARHARRTWESSEPAKNNNPGSDPLHVHLYLTRKEIRAHGIRTFENSLVVPVYSPDKQIVNLQFIDAGSGERSKRFIEGGRVAGCYYYIKKADNDYGGTFCVCEGFATGATIQESTGYGTYVAFHSGNLLAVARMVAERHPDAQIIIAADDDWKNTPNAGIKSARKAARAIGALLAIPTFPLTRAKGATDFNDMAKASAIGRKVVRDAINKASEPEDDEEEDAPMDKDERNRLIDQLCQITDPIDYALERKKVAKDIGIPVGVLDKEVKRLRAELVQKANEIPPDTKQLRKELRASAREIIDCEDVLELFADDFRYFIAGEKTNAQLLYLIGTSRLFDKCMHAAIKGPSSGGKSEIRKAVLKYFPPECVISFTSLTEKALLYIPDGFEHKILSMAEAQRQEEMAFQDYLLRELLSEGKLRHLVPVKAGDKIETVTIEKNGPVAFVVTTTATKLNPENETRMLSLEVDVSEDQTKKVLRQVALIEGLNRPVDDQDFQPWHDFQRWLAAGDCDVVVPFAKVLVKMIKGTWVVRWRRDLGQLLRAIKAHALLHRNHRERNSKGAIVATIQEDYAIVRDLMDDIMATTADLKVREQVIRTIDTVKRLQSREHADNARSWDLREAAGQGGVPSTEVSKALKLDKGSAWRLLKQAQEAGYLINLEQRRGRPGRYQTTRTQPPTGSDNLPDPDRLEQNYHDVLDARRADKSVKKVRKPDTR
jgi:phage/plasmid primase-like uncharacterized protein